MMGLTPQLHRCFDYLKAYHDANGVPPTLQEIMVSQGLRSKSGVHRLLTELEQRGYIRRLAKLPRAIEILHQGLICPHCGHVAGSDRCRAAAAKPVTYSSTPKQQVAA